MTLNVDIQFPTSLQVKTGAIQQLTDAIPDVDLGSISGYNFAITNGYLTVSYLTNGIPSYTTSLNGTFTVELPEYQVHQDVLDDLCYQYKYDYRNRLVEKKVPQKAWEYIVYDKLDRPRLTQSGSNDWLFTKYDAFDRVTYTGKWEYISPLYVTGTALRKELQANIDVHTVLNETRVSEHTLGNDSYFEYSNVSYPIVSDYLTANYYDTYTKEANIKFEAKVGSFSGGNILYGEALHIISNVKSLATVSKVRVVGTDKWVLSATYYDKKARPLVIASKNDYLKTTDYVLNELDFIGNLTADLSFHEKENEPNITVTNGYTYDHQNKLLTQKQLINDGDWEVIVSNEYDELGQLVKKDVGNSRSNPLQTVDYKYNIRGWLKQINDVTNLNNDLFSF